MKRILKNKILYFVMACLAILTAACESDALDNANGMSSNEDTRLKLDLNKECITRGMITSTTFQYGDSILVVVTDHENSDKMTFVTSAVYKKYIGWQVDPKNILDFGEPFNGNAWTTADVFVYYPYSLVHSGFDKDTKTIKLENLLKQEDILYGKCEGVSKNNPTANISCHHAMSCISFSISNKSDKNAHIEKIQMEPGSSKFLGYSGTLSQSGLTDIKYTYEQTIEYSINIPAGETQNIDLLLAPTEDAYKQMLEEGTTSDRWTMIMTLNDTRVVFDIDLRIWQAGSQYVYPINLPTDLPELMPKKVYMYDRWDGKHVYYSNINVGAVSETDYGRLFGWGDPTGKLTSVNLKDYPSATPPVSIAGTNYDIATVNWGGKWQMPSNSDFWDLKVKCEDPEWIEIDGVYGVKLTSKVTGESIFFPKAPQRDGTAVTHYNSSYYWLGELNKDDNTKAGTLYFDYNTMYTKPLTFYPTAGLERYTGLPVRAIWIDD